MEFINNVESLEGKCMKEQKKRALITGATSGIGEAISYVLAREGYDLILVARDQGKLEQLQNRLIQAYNKIIHIFSIDLMKPEDIQCLVEAIDGQALTIDIFVNNAGIGVYGAFSNIAAEQDLKVIDTNIKGFTFLLKQIKPYLNKHACVLQVASTAAFAPGPYMAVYYASKAYVLSLSLALREEWKKDGMNVSILCPGPTKTDFIKKANMRKSDFVKFIAMNPEDVAQAAYKGIKKHKAVIIPGWTNKLACLVMALLPLSIKVKLVCKTQKH